MTTFHPFYIESYDFLLSTFPPRPYSAADSNVYKLTDPRTYNLICLRLMHQTPTNDWRLQFRYADKETISCEWHRE